VEVSGTTLHLAFHRARADSDHFLCNFGRDAWPHFATANSVANPFVSSRKILPIYTVGLRELKLVVAVAEEILALLILRLETRASEVIEKPLLLC